MNEIDLQEQLFNRFYQLNEVSGLKLLDRNVYRPNENFAVPPSKRWFELSFLSNPPNAASNFDDAQDRYTGFMQIDICTPLSKGEDECFNKYRWINRLFSRGTMFGDILIERCYIARKTAESDHYRLIVKVEWTADIDKEELVEEGMNQP